MNYSTAVFLVNDAARAVLATYEADENAKRSMFKTFDKGLKVDDLVIVPTNTRHKMTVVRIVAVDVDVNFDNDVQVEWIIAKVDPAHYALLLEQEAQAIQVIRSAELRKKRDELKKAMFADAEDAIKQLPLAGRTIEGGTV